MGFFSIKTKIVALISGALALTLAAYLAAGTSLIIRDKTSYLYDNALTEVTGNASVLESRIDRAVLLMRAHAKRITTRSVTREIREELVAAGLHATGTIGFERSMRDPFVRTAGGERKDDLARGLAQIRSTPDELRASGRVFGKPLSGGLLPLLVAAGDHILIGLFSPRGEWLEPMSRLSVLLLVDEKGNVIARRDGSAPEGGGSARAAITDESLLPLLRSEFDSGVRDLSVGGLQFIASYSRLSDRKLALIQLLPREVVFSASKALMDRSMVLGASIFLVALAFTLVVVRRLVLRLRQMWHATRSVASGDFSVRLPVSASKRFGDDEVSELARSFNFMAEKVTDLMQQTADKARMEKELETAQFVQRRYSPHEDFSDRNLRVSGAIVPASECSGDWWQYKRVGDELYVFVGDVTGHGVSAALVTAAAHSALHLIFHLCEGRRDAVPPSLPLIVRSLNQAVRSGSGGSATMTLWAMKLNLKTGIAEVVNAAHPFGYLLRAGQKAKSYPGEPISPVGLKDDIEVKTTRLQLGPGDTFFLYTDGLFDERRDGSKLNKKAFLASLEKSAGEGLAADEFLGAAQDEALRFFGRSSGDRVDDITLVTLTVPRDAELALPRERAS